MSQSYRTVIVACIVALLLPAIGNATQIEYRSPRQLGEQAEIVVRGRVLSSESFWNESRTKVFTRTSIAVDETYKGDDRSTVDVIQLGGVVGNIMVNVHGAPHWQAGEEVLLFAEPYAAGDYRVSGFCQGKLRIMRDEATGEAFVETAPEGAVRGMEIRDPAGQSAPLRRVATPLDEFVSYALDTSEAEEVSR
jgi:hypothetical protein